MKSKQYSSLSASGDADTQMRRIRKSAEPRAEYPAERGIIESTNLNHITLGVLEEA